LSELKRAKYQVIAEAGKQKGWRVSIRTVEVGCRKFPAASVSYLLRDLGMRGRQKITLLGEIGKAAESASHTVWKCCQMKEWGAKK
jgi:hypothetical protein